MTEEGLREKYRAIEPPAELKGHVGAACRAAKKKRTALSRRIASAAACLVVVLALSVYGLYPVPGVSCGDQAVGRAALTVAGETIFVQEAAEEGPVPFGIQAARMGGEAVEGCIPLTFDRAATVSVSGGTLYRFDALSGGVLAEGSGCRVEAGETLFWQPDGDGGILTARAFARALTLHASAADGGWTLSK